MTTSSCAHCLNLIIKFLQDLREKVVGGHQNSIPCTEDDRNETIQKDESKFA